MPTSISLKGTELCAAFALFLILSILSVPFSPSSPLSESLSLEVSTFGDRRHHQDMAHETKARERAHPTPLLRTKTPVSPNFVATH